MYEGRMMHLRNHVRRSGRFSCGSPWRTRQYATAPVEAATTARPFAWRFRNAIYGTSSALLLTLGYFYFTDTRAGIHQWLAVPSLRWIYNDAEEAHQAGVKILKTLYTFGLYPGERGYVEHGDDLGVEVCPHTLFFRQIATTIE